MSRIAVLMLLTLLGIPLAARAGYEKGELLLKANFRTEASLQPWGGEKGEFIPGSGLSGGGAMMLTDNRLRDYPLDPGKFSGTVIFGGTFRIEEVRRLQEKPYYGAKLMLVVKLRNGSTLWKEPHELPRVGSTGWRYAETVINLPPAGEIAELFIRVGLEHAEGKYFLDHIRIHRARAVPERDENFARRDPAAQWPGGRYRGFMSGRDLSENAFRKLREWNVNLLRYQINAAIRSKEIPVDISTPEKYLDWINFEIGRLDEVMLLAQKYGVKIAIDLHTGPPGSTRDSVSSNIVTDPEAVLNQLKTVWRKLAAHYRGNPLIYGYDILNEPRTEDYLPGEKAPWWRIAEAVAREIRSVDPDTPIIIEPDLAAVRELRHIDVPNLIYSVHAYYPIEYTHQIPPDSLSWNYPAYIQGIKCDRESLRRDLMPIREFQLKYNVPVFVGEFSVSVWAPNGEKYLEDLVDVFEEFGWDWTYHAFREWAGWCLEHEGLPGWNVKTAPDTPRLLKIREVLKKNRPVQSDLRNSPGLLPNRLEKTLLK